MRTPGQTPLTFWGLPPEPLTILERGSVQASSELAAGRLTWSIVAGGCLNHWLLWLPVAIREVLGFSARSTVLRRVSSQRTLVQKASDRNHLLTCDPRMGRETRLPGAPREGVWRGLLA